MRAKASNVSASGKGKRFNPSNNRGSDKRKDTKQPRYTIVDVIGSVMIFVTIILSDLRNNIRYPDYDKDLFLTGSSAVDAASQWISNVRVLCHELKLSSSIKPQELV